MNTFRILALTATGAAHVSARLLLKTTAGQDNLVKTEDANNFFAPGTPGVKPKAARKVVLCCVAVAALIAIGVAVYMKVMESKEKIEAGIIEAEMSLEQLKPSLGKLKTEFLNLEASAKSWIGYYDDIDNHKLYRNRKLWEDSNPMKETVHRNGGVSYRPYTFDEWLDINPSESVDVSDVKKWGEYGVGESRPLLKAALGTFGDYGRSKLSDWTRKDAILFPVNYIIERPESEAFKNASARLNMVIESNKSWSPQEATGEAIVERLALLNSLEGALHELGNSVDRELVGNVKEYLRLSREEAEEASRRLNKEEEYNNLLRA